MIDCYLFKHKTYVAFSIIRDKNGCIVVNLCKCVALENYFALTQRLTCTKISVGNQGTNIFTGGWFHTLLNLLSNATKVVGILRLRSYLNTFLDEIM